MSEIPAYRRVLLKLSGEALMGERPFGFDMAAIDVIADDVRMVHAAGVQLGIVVGAGNLIRGASTAGINRVNADYMGMLSTVVNALALRDRLAAAGVDARVMSAIPLAPVCEAYARDRALRHLEDGRVVVLAAGTGNPFFTTDTAATLRAAELGCDALLKGTQVDGVYEADPKREPGARRYEQISYDEVLALNLKVMDATAIALARETGMRILVFSMHSKGAFYEAVLGRGKFTAIG
jgi:uridylate kinase